MTQETRDVLSEWKKPSTIITILALGVSLVGGYQSLKNDVNNLAAIQAQQERRISNIEVAQREDHDLLIEIRTDLKAVKLTTTGKP